MSTEAVDNVARTLAACSGKDFDRMDDYEKSFWRDPVQNVLAHAWDKGAEAGEDNVWSGEHTNPYRS